MSQDYSLGTRYGPRPDYPLLRHILEDLHPQGWALEFGVANGTSLGIIAAHMPVVGFDSFLGLPEEWEGYPKGTFAPTDPETGWTSGEPPVIANSQLEIGMFDDTLPSFDFSAVAPLGLVHIDCDLYSSTTTVLTHVGPHLQPRCYVILDEAFTMDGADLDELRAWREFADRTQIQWSVIGNTDCAWAIRIS